MTIFLRWPNVWALGICHGLLGALAYYVVLQRDVWTGYNYSDELSFR